MKIKYIIKPNHINVGNKIRLKQTPAEDKWRRWWGTDVYELIWTDGKNIHVKRCDGKIFKDLGAKLQNMEKV